MWTSSLYKRTDCVIILDRNFASIPQKEDFIIMLKGKTVLLGVTGGIAAYKAAALASALVNSTARWK